ncbi:iron-containing alcohol dehydrogenase [Clostridium tarantellae]|uniref:Iron-containing alcohol dehydrogenase n=1 Tax=Clostridium tarantellae TaxID=39493 RepID=A0A6I1MMW1_9CLOT|nr:iron-containing alcohol dehydrogenase [Clostridium tarantellae]MPQ43582.1 iron-containing alcohol dehydrogenase [Clostridium tarantellae]
MEFNYYIPTKILFGKGKLEELGKIELPGKKALIVISKGRAMVDNGYLDKVKNLLNMNNVEFSVFDKILCNPIKQHVQEGAKLAIENKCDFILGLGGGSTIDSAKSIAIMAKNPGDYWDYIIGGSGKGKMVKNGALPIVAITTTAGTGTEADPWTVITNEKTKEKIGFGIKETFPKISIVDPELMLTVPKELTAYQGFDALFHSTEGYIASVATPISDLYALKSIELLTKYLPKVIENGEDIEARTKVALANTLSGLVESTSSCTSEHSMEHALSAFHNNLPHGAGLIMLSEAYYEFFMNKVPDKFIDMAKAMGEDVDSLKDEDKPKAFIKALKKLQKKCGVDNLKMSSYGIKKEEIEDMGQNARDTMGGLFYADPYILSYEETVDIMNKSYR